MEDRSNKTIMCSVLFLDIVEYSKKSVSGQISLKDRFNTYLSEAIHDVPATDRIILDTGDGAAVNFLGDVESALTAALRLRASLLAEDPYLEPQLLVRIGINLGPVRLVRDINGQPNIVGDGINVAQRVMGFADASQILVSRSYYDAVSRLSAQYTGMFHYQGSRTDKHVREHEIYAIGYPGDQTTKRMPVEDLSEKAPGGFGGLLARIGEMSRSNGDEPGFKPRAKYIAMVVLPLLMLAGILTLINKKPLETQPVLTVETMPPASSVPDASVQAKPSVASAADKKTLEKSPAEKAATEKAAKDKSSAQPTAKHKAEPAPAKKPVATAKSGDAQQGKKADIAVARNAVEPDDDKPEAIKDGHISIGCKDDMQGDVDVFVDGTKKGKLVSGALMVTTKPGKHKVIVTHKSFGVYSEAVDVDPGKTEKIRPKACN